MEKFEYLKKIWRKDINFDKNINFNIVINKQSKIKQRIYLTCLFEMIFWLFLSFFIGINNKDYINMMANDGVITTLDF